MTISIKVFAPVLAGALMVAGCQQGGQKQTLGALLGAGAGAAIGSQIGSGKGQLAAVAIGTLLGAAIGSELGASLDAQDRALASRAETRAHTAPIGQPIAWENPDSGHSGTIVAVREGHEKASDRYCREYETEIRIGGRSETGVGTACQNPDGSWDIVS
ncbi:MAG: RT0821/Lpp0805 family surface protein [Alphaproteobacteria bacterium]|nr:RT0821/Lpp0805 family surface protein [Alphaproteobacteria bacterium]